MFWTGMSKRPKNKIVWDTSDPIRFLFLTRSKDTFEKQVLLNSPSNQSNIQTKNIKVAIHNSFQPHFSSSAKPNARRKCAKLTKYRKQIIRKIHSNRKMIHKSLLSFQYSVQSKRTPFNHCKSYAKYSILKLIWWKALRYFKWNIYLYILCYIDAKPNEYRACPSTNIPHFSPNVLIYMVTCNSLKSRNHGFHDVVILL